MNFGIVVNEESLKEVLKGCEKAVSELVSNVTEDIYRNIVSLDHRTDRKYDFPYPFWSGAYMASWRISSGFVRVDYAQQRFDMGKYKMEAHPYELPSMSNYDFSYSGNYAVVHISNAAPYAGELETIGSKKHKSPWMVAHHSVNTTVARFRLH